MGISVSHPAPDRDGFDVHLRERLCRQEFLFNAFKALSFNGIDGDYAEFGSSGGMTFGLAYLEARRHGHPAKLWAFDSFAGLPDRKAADEHPRWSAGKMATTLDEFRAACAQNGIPTEAYSVVPGFYEQTLPAIAPDDPPNDVALAYVDCDLYSSTVSVLDFLGHRVKHGMIVAFDDYFCWSATELSGDRKAMLEFARANPGWHWLPYMQFGWHAMSFVIEDRALVEGNGPA